jgi:chemotaxis methyl-accepting protein methylase
LDGQIYPVLKFDGQNQTKAKVGWSKMDFFHVKNIIIYFHHENKNKKSKKSKLKSHYQLRDEHIKQL